MDTHYVVKVSGRRVLDTFDPVRAHRRADRESRRHGARNVRVLTVGSRR